MKIKEFIKKLEEIKKEHGAFVEVKMADGISIVSPIFLKDFQNQEAVIITDEKLWKK